LDSAGTRTWPALDVHLPHCSPELKDLVLADLDDFQPFALQDLEESESLRAFFDTPAARNSAWHGLQAAFSGRLLITPVDVADENWAARSQADLQPIQIGRLIIAPPWAVPSSAALQPTTVLIEPSMAFGTGHHASTRLAVKALQSLDLQPTPVLDLGTGSAVLAICAVRLGAPSAVGLDTDPDALAAARRNLDLNGVQDRIQLVEADFRSRSSSAPVVLANLTGALLDRFAETISACLEPTGFLVASGFTTDEGTVVPSLQRHLELVSAEAEDDWICATLRRR
jgi:ribosomal protein L11 methyltransferase